MELSAIEWTDHTQNFWEGCQNVSKGCDLCYAEARNKRFGGGVAGNWGPSVPRRRMSVNTRVNPHRWNKAHEAFYAAHGRRQRVFCSSLSDWLDNAVPIEWFIEVLDTVRLTPNLDWQLLTKRIGNWRKRMQEAYDHLTDQPVLNVALSVWVYEWLSGNAPANVWMGATVVNQEEADRDIPKLLAVPARVRFLSMEPLLGSVSLDAIPIYGEDEKQLLHWVIAGGESGPGARPAHPDWFRSLRDQCVAAGVPFLFKQHGEWVSVSEVEGDGPHHYFPDGATVRRIGKKAAGRLLDGIEHNGFPNAQP